MSTRVASLVAERERILEALREQGWNIEDAYANFFWMPFGADTERATEHFIAAGLSVRAFAGEGIRISIGEREANDRVLTVCENLKKEGFSLNN